MTARLTTRPALLCGEDVLLGEKVVGSLMEAADLSWRFFLADTPAAQSLPHPFPHHLKAKSREAALRFLEAALDFIEEEVPSGPSL